MSPNKEILERARLAAQEEGNALNTVPLTDIPVDSTIGTTKEDIRQASDQADEELRSPLTTSLSGGVEDEVAMIKAQMSELRRKLKDLGFGPKPRSKTEPTRLEVAKEKPKISHHTRDVKRAVKVSNEFSKDFGKASSDYHKFLKHTKHELLRAKPELANMKKSEVDRMAREMIREEKMMKK